MRQTSDVYVSLDDDHNLEVCVSVSYHYDPDDAPEHLRIEEVCTGSHATGWSALKREVVKLLEPWLLRQAEDGLTPEIMAESYANAVAWDEDEATQARIDAWKERRASGESK